MTAKRERRSVLPVRWMGDQLTSRKMSGRKLHVRMDGQTKTLTYTKRQVVASCRV